MLSKTRKSLNIMTCLGFIVAGYTLSSAPGNALQGWCSCWEKMSPVAANCLKRTIFELPEVSSLKKKCEDYCKEPPMVGHYDIGKGLFDECQHPIGQ